jgi:hypothetical protein
MSSTSGLRTVLVDQLMQLGQHTPILRRVAVPIQNWATRTEAIVDVETAKKGPTRGEIFSVKPPRGLCAALPAALWNITVGICGAPFFAAGTAVAGLLDGGPPGFVVGCGTGVVWGLLLAAVGHIACASQLCAGAANSVSAPYRMHYKQQAWHPIRCAWLPLTTAEDAFMRTQPGDQALWDAAMARQAKRYNRSSAGAEERSLYDYLGVDRGATAPEIKAAYRRVSQHLHPDKNPDPNAHAQFQEATRAYKTLTDPAKRKKYDAGGEQAIKNDGQMSKRDALRGVFGGGALCQLTGDVRNGRFSRKMIDEVYYLQPEVTAVVLRMRNACALELLTYLDGFDPVAEKKRAAAAAPGTKAPPTAWQAAVRKRLMGFVNVGLAKEVLFVAAIEYHRQARLVDRSPRDRVLQLWVTDAPAKHYRRAMPYAVMLLTGAAKRRDKAYIMDMVWQLSAPEITANAEHAARCVLYDESASTEELERRREALLALAGTFLDAGNAYKGASDAVVEKLSQSVASHAKSQQQQQQRDNQ